MTIDIFKDKTIYNYLEQFNKDVIDAGNSSKYPTDNNYDTSKNEASYWFNPENIKLGPVQPPYNPNYPNPADFQFDLKFNLILHCANYPTLFVVNELYKNNQDILIEDLACGMSQVSFYLSKLGFKNFSFIDNFTQMPKSLLVELMNKTEMNYQINNLELEPTVVNIVAWPVYSKRIDEFNNVYLYDKLEPPTGEQYIPESVELFCSYYHLYNDKTLAGINYPEFIKRFQFLCTDEHKIMFIYCRKDKFEEFNNVLKKYEI